MTQSMSDRLRSMSDRILELWEERVRATVIAARNLEPSHLRNSIPLVLEALAYTLDHLEKSEEPELSVSQAHGLERASRPEYSIKQVILEYRLLRRTIFDVLAPDLVDPRARNAIINVIEVGISEATAAFADYQYRLREQFISALAHDLRNPLTAAKAAAQLNLRHPERVDSSQILSARIVDSISRTERMIQDLLDSNQVQAGGKLPLNYEPNDMRVIIKMTLEETTTALGDHFKFDPGTSPVSGHWDTGYIKRALENLLVNAVKYGDPLTPVSISLDENQGLVTISVHNAGEPISKADQYTIFDPFRQIVKLKKEKKQGWGIGLSLVKGVAQAHGGTISVESNEKSGTTFTLTLPLEPSDAHKIAA
ncbi:MAG TPA: two-component sensor histidine kinase [Bdellovibrionales bacterium]|nr:two-component sensor histidine kinase [Bdellovibrionales bacterium]HCM39020.1 two-component sensor histidine kinase [Bdellovibrionales bacterium]